MCTLRAEDQKMHNIQCFLSAISRFCVTGQPKILDLDYFVLIWWQTHKKTSNPELKSRVF